jgi:lipopolysaccharide transport system permease protein
MFVGLLPWIWFSSSVIGGASSISDRRDLLTKVRFPAQVLPATVVMTNGVNFLLSLPLVFLLALASGVKPTIHLLAVPAVVATQMLFILGVSYLLSALNVTFRDLQHIASNLVTLGMFLTPVFYPIEALPEQYHAFLLYLNPMAGFVNAYQDLLYYHRFPNLGPLAAATAFSLFILAVSSEYFEARREEFAELV